MLHIGNLSVIASDFEIECEDFKIVENKDYWADSFIAYLNDGLLYFQKLSSEEKLLDGVNIVPYFNGVLDPRYEICVAISDVEIFDVYAKITLVTNSRVRINIAIELVKLSEDEKKEITEVLTKDCPLGYWKLSGADYGFATSRNKALDLTKGAMNYNGGSITIGVGVNAFRDKVVLPKGFGNGELPPFRNYFNNPRNYTVGNGWGGVGVVSVPKDHPVTKDEAWRYTKEAGAMPMGWGYQIDPTDRWVIFQATYEQKNKGGRFLPAINEDSKRLTFSTVIDQLFFGNNDENIGVPNTQAFETFDGDSGFVFSKFSTTRKEYFS